MRRMEKDKYDEEEFIAEVAGEADTTPCLVAPARATLDVDKREEHAPVPYQGVSEGGGRNGDVRCPSVRPVTGRTRLEGVGKKQKQKPEQREATVHEFSESGGGL